MTNINQHKHIIITGDQVNALGVLRSLAEGNVSPILIYAVESRFRKIVISSKYAKKCHKVSSYEEAIKLLIDVYGLEENKPFVYTCDDTIAYLMDSHYNDLIDKFYFFNAGEQGRINELLNKQVQCSLAKQCGLDIPKQEMVNVGILPTTLQYPVLTKTLMSTMGRWKEDYFICDNKEQLLEAYKVIQSPQLLLQEYIQKKNELEIWGFSINGGQEVYLPFQKSYFRLSNSSYGGYMYFTPTRNKDLIDKITTLIKACKYTGCFEVEFLVDNNDKLWFLEVNFRFAMSNYAVTFGGVNYPLTWAKSLLENKIQMNSEIKEYFTAINDAQDFGQSVVGKKVSLLQWIQDIHNADMLFYYNPKDPKPAWAFWWYKIVRKFRKKLLKR